MWFFEIDKVKAEKDAVVDFMAEKLNMSEVWKNTFVQDLNKQIDSSTLFPAI